MNRSEVRGGQCPDCQRDAPHPDRERQRPMHRFLSRWDEAQRRWYVALEAARLGPGGERLVAQSTGLAETPPPRGRTALAPGLARAPPGPGRRARGGAPPRRKKTPAPPTRRGAP